MGQGWDQSPWPLWPQPSLRSVQTSVGGNQPHWLPTCSLPKQPFTTTTGRVTAPPEGSQPALTPTQTSTTQHPSPHTTCRHATSSPCSLLASSITFASQLYCIHILINGVSAVQFNRENTSNTTSNSNLPLQSFIFLPVSRVG